MSEHTFTEFSRNEDSVDYYLNGIHVFSANHDDHGWSGMGAIGEVVRNIAGVLGADVQTFE